MAKRPARPRHIEYRGLGVAGLHDLHAVQWGRRDSKRVVLCAHGYSGNSRDFDYLARELSRDARVICPDVAGRGESAWLGSPMQYHFGQFLADIRTLLAKLDVQQVDWVGTSMGGLLGLLLASQPSNPIRRLVMNDIGAFVPLDALQHIGRNLQAPEGFASLADVEAHMRRTHSEWGELTDEQWKHFAVHGSRQTENGYRLHFDPKIARMAQPLPFATGLFFWDAWYRVRCPVLLMRGEQSDVFPAAVAGTMLDVKPQAQLVEIAGAGHAPSLMAPEQIRVVREFLDRRSIAEVSRRNADEPRQRILPPRAA
ncbi:MAG: alpha/beta fold hydrolase [Usitatibacter sp.]